MGKLLDEVTVDSTTRWFAQFVTDEYYLRGHFNRFKLTKEFVLEDIRAPEEMLEVGAHWLHNAFFFANEGHLLHGVDAPNTMRNPAVQAAARAMGATLHVANHLELGDGIRDFDENSMDTVLMCETIEHLAFNPIPLWTEIYRVLKPGGRIVITTPNANQWSKRKAQIRRLFRGAGAGIEVSEIFAAGTFGHHWKEYTAGELSEYFKALSPDFEVARTKFVNIGEPPPRRRAAILGEEFYADMIFMEIALPAKARGVVLRAPWLPQYS